VTRIAVVGTEKRTAFQAGGAISFCVRTRHAKRTMNAGRKAQNNAGQSSPNEGAKANDADD
jgi:hypothetical protein